MIRWYVCENILDKWVGCGLLINLCMCFLFQWFLVEFIQNACNYIWLPTSSFSWSIQGRSYLNDMFLETCGVGKFKEATNEGPLQLVRWVYRFVCKA